MSISFSFGSALPVDIPLHDTDDWVVLGTVGKFTIATNGEEAEAVWSQADIKDWKDYVQDHTYTWTAEVGQDDRVLPSHQCPHCDRDRHDGPLTRRVARMWDSHHWDEDYDPDHDTSYIVCLGSDAIGPARPTRVKTCDDIQSVLMAIPNPLFYSWADDEPVCQLCQKPACGQGLW